MYKFDQIISIFSLSVKIMPPITAFYCDTIETAVDQSGMRDPRHPATSGTAKFRLTYNEDFSVLRSSKREFLSTQHKKTIFI